MQSYQKTGPSVHRFEDDLATIAGLFGEEGFGRLPAVLRRPGPQPCNRIPPTYADAMLRLHVGRHAEDWERFKLLLRAGRMIRRMVRKMLDSEIEPIVAELLKRRRRAG